MKKGSITISVPSTTTQEEIKEIREQFKKNEAMKDYRLNILISGNEDLKENLKNFLKTMLNAQFLFLSYATIVL